MLIGVAALSAWGFYQFNNILAKKTAAIPADASLLERLLAQKTLYLDAFAEMYGGIFEATVFICVVGALLGLLLGSRKRRAVEPDEPEVPEQQALAIPATGRESLTRHQAQHQIRADAFDAVELPAQGVRDAGHPDVVDGGDGPAQQDWRDVGQDPVDRPGPQEGAGEGGPALDAAHRCDPTAP